MLIANIGQQLSHKPFERKSWWGIKWGDFIEISPHLSEEYSLWQREDSHLETIRLFGLPPDKLKEEIASYWNKPFWRRCLLSFFTDINDKIVIWSYYKRCLSFRIIRNEHLALEQRLVVYDPEQHFISCLINKFKQDTSALENYLEKYAGNAKWMEKNLERLLIKYEKKRQKVFVKQSNKYLTTLANGSEQESVRKKLEEEYQGIEKMLRNYIKNSYQENSIQQEASLPMEENLNQDLVYVGPALVIEKKENPYLY